MEEWQPELVFTEADKGEKLTISACGHVKVGRQTREVYWGDANHGDKQPAPISGAVIIVSVTDEWVKYGQGRNDRFRNPRIAGGFVVNSSELRRVNFTMEALDPPPLQPRSSARRHVPPLPPHPCPNDFGWQILSLTLSIAHVAGRLLTRFTCIFAFVHICTVHIHVFDIKLLEQGLS